jgi:F0F1-type ATP synthase delta subunit
MIPLIFLVVLQLAIAGIVIFFLKRVLNRELEKVAVEKLVSIKPSESVDLVTVYYAYSLPSVIEQEIRTLIKNKFTEAKIIFEQLRPLKGGLMIKIKDEILDFSLSSRLENFWS